MKKGLYNDIGTLKRTMLRIEDFFIDHRFGVETRKDYIVPDTISKNLDGLGYAPTHYRVLQTIFRALPELKDKTFVDFGCGKGRGLLLAGSQGCKKVIGVEINKKLCDSAHSNLSSVTRKHSFQYEIVQEDAAGYIPEGGDIFFIFNPFGWKTTKKVLLNLKKSLVKCPRQVYILYHSPAFDFLFESLPWLELYKNLDHVHTKIYRNKDFVEPMDKA